MLSPLFRFLCGRSYSLYNVCEKFCRWEERTHSMRLVVLMISIEQRGHVSDCYNCLTDINGIHFKKKTVIYPNLL